MRCEACKPLLDDFIDGDLPQNLHADVEQHLRECGECGWEAESLQRLSRHAASLPKSIQPGKDLWPEIEAEIRVKRGDHRKTAVWLWRIAAAAMLGSILLAGSYMVLRKQTGDNSRSAVSKVFEKGPLDNVEEASTRKVDNTSGAVRNSEPPGPQNAGQSLSSNSPGASLTYPLDPSTRVFTSNYGIYAVREDRDPKSLAVSRNYILRFDKNGTQSWIPPLPPGSTVRSIYPGRENQFWVCWEVQQPAFQVGIAELEFGVDSQIKNLWKTGELFIAGFAVSPQGWIYASGFRNDLSRSIAKLIKGQSVTTELIHIIDPATGSERHIMPITLRPKFDSQLWAGQTALEMTSLATQTAIAVKSNGNFFVTIDRASALSSVGDLIKNQALEYSPDGSIAQKWELDDNEPNSYLNKIFVDVDDSVVAEIISYPDSRASNSLNEAKDRYLLRLSLDGRVTRYNPAVYPNEVIYGWMGQKRELVTLLRGSGLQEINIHKLPF